MRDFGTAALAAIEAGQALSVAAVSILTEPDAFNVWGGYGPLTIGDTVFAGIGDRGLVESSTTTVGGSEQNITLELSGLDADTIALVDHVGLRRAPVIVYRLIFDASGTQLLAAPVFARGRVDQAPTEETAGGTATIRCFVETSARGLGRGGGRIRSDADQRLIDPTDDGLKNASFAGQTTIYWGGKIPADARAAFGAVPSGAGYGGGYVNLGTFDNLNLMP